MKLKRNAKISMFVFIIVAVLIVLAGFLNLFLNSSDGYKKNEKIAIENCITLCNLEVSKGTLLNDGPCLSEEIAPGWVCDVAHSPRIDLIDNNPNNRCENYGKKGTKHYVEVTEKCKLIKAK
ncbi:MAG: hypothetical protein WCY27_03140 [archaeon]|nr:hypothetical protein [archaeon]MDD2477476.1 hypothetical protein [Candidatus ainarchaeum sp.]MDD3084780.1 hypothetical protein [Candidatus ainarchaeum sp.]MDD4221481.1 hypothetical protein [Candidatus ainarchaeum sp.]MDD4662420.1 hypothetical protein [Candidatus ainarchaeum sp.]